MQALWSRAAQAHVCSCRTCIQVTNSIVRSSTSRVPPRKVSITDVFTACYTSIMAVAAVADAGHKEKRRRDLDHRLENAKAGLAAIMQSTTSLDDARFATPSQELDNSISPNRMVEALKSICVPSSQLRRHIQGQKYRKSNLTSMRHHFGLRPGSAEPAPIDFDATREAIKLEEETRDTIKRELTMALHFSRLTDMLSNLVDELLLQGHRQSCLDNDPLAIRRSIESLDSPWTMIRLLRSEGYPNYQLTGLDPEATKTFRRQLDEALGSIFRDWGEAVADERRWHPKQIKNWVAKICYNLLVTRVSPDIQTYNVLLHGFTRLGEHRLGQLVVDSFLYHSHYRPTQQTLVCLLQHYRANEDILAFYHLIRRLVGIDIRGPKIRRQPVKRVKKVPKLRVWAQTSDVAVHSGWVIQRAWINKPVMEAVISGLLYFGQVQHAVKVWAALVQTTDDVGRSILHQLLDQVLQTVDLTAARLLTQCLVVNAAALTSMLFGDATDTPKLVRKIQLLIAIASVETRVLQMRPLVPLGISLPSNCRHLAVTLQMVDMFHYTGQLGSILKRLRRQTRNPDILSNTASLAIHGLAQLRSSTDRSRRLSAQYHRLARFANIDRQVTAAQQKCAWILETFFCIVSMHLPSLYGAFLRRSDVPFLERYNSWANMILANSLPEQIGQQIRDAIFVGTMLENKFKMILLGSISGEDRHRLMKAYKELPLQLVLRARAAEARVHATEAAPKLHYLRHLRRIMGMLSSISFGKEPLSARGTTDQKHDVLSGT